MARHTQCVFRARVTVMTTLSTRHSGPVVRCVIGACYEGEETCREGCIAPLFTQYQIKNNVVYELLFRIFYYLFGWEKRHLHTGGSCPVVSGHGVCDYDRLRKLCPIFHFVM